MVKLLALMGNALSDKDSMGPCFLYPFSKGLMSKSVPTPSGVRAVFPLWVERSVCPERQAGSWRNHSECQNCLQWGRSNLEVTPRSGRTLVY